MSEQDNTAALPEWAIVEIMGHRRHGGRISEVSHFGATLLRIDVPGEGEEVIATHFYGGAAIFSITPTDEDTARRVAAFERPRPVARLSYRDRYDDDDDFVEAEEVDEPAPMEEPAEAPDAEHLRPGDDDDEELPW